MSGTIHLIIPITKVYKFNTSSTKVLQKLTNKMCSYSTFPSLELSESEVYLKLSLLVLIQGNNLQYSSEKWEETSQCVFHCMRVEHSIKKLNNTQRHTSQHKHYSLVQ